MAVPTLSQQRSEPSQRPNRFRGIATLAFWWRLLASVAAGLLLYAASPPRDLWWLAPIAFTLFAAALYRRGSAAGFGCGVVFGFAYLLPLLGWLQDFLGAQFGPWPWLGVAGVEAVFIGLGGAGMARVSRLPAAPVWMAAVFVSVESLRSAVPFGGFPWGRLAFTQNTGALLPLASLGGAVALSFAVALIGSALAQAVLRWREPRGLIAPLATAVVPVLAGLAVLPTIGTDPNAGTARVGVVQGNAPNVGLDLLYEGDVLHDNHIAGAEQLAQDVRSGRAPRPDFVVLPETVGRWGPSRTDPELSRAAQQLNAPLIVGGTSRGSDGNPRNEVVRWDPARGATDEYVKQHLVPFAESIPMRSVARLVSPFVDQVQDDMVPGTRPGVLNAGPARVGSGLCYDVAYDDVFTGAVRDGANVLAVPTNNAWYGRSEMTYQHLAMSQLRAVEHGRSMVVSATSGVSAIIRPDGVMTERTGQFTAQNLDARIPLRDTLTPATRLGSAPLWIVVVLALGGLAASFRQRARAR